MHQPVFYLASPNTQQQADHCRGMPVLLSYGVVRRRRGENWITKGYTQSFSRILIDSGAYSAMNSGANIDVCDYRRWAEGWLGEADAVAGLDDINGDWRRSISNYEAFPESFPTYHDTDPPELLDELVHMAQERGGWIGLGIKPPRNGKTDWVISALDRIPQDVHVHGWALYRYAGLREFRTRPRHSFDSTNWWRDAMKLRTQSLTEHLTYGECLEIIVKRYQRGLRHMASSQRELFDKEASSQRELFDKETS